LPAAPHLQRHRNIGGAGRGSEAHRHGVIAVTARHTAHAHTWLMADAGRRATMRSLHTLTPTGILARRIGRALKRGLLLHTYFDRLRFGCVLMIVLGPVFGVVEWHNRQRIEDILARGAVTEAAVTGTRVTTGRSTTYSVDLAWRDTQGMQHSVAQMTVSSAFYSQVTRVSPPKARIKYLTDREASRRTIALLDDPPRKPNRANLLPGWMVPSLMGLIGLALLTLWRSWRRRVARMA
jgi:hypothetical protein